MRNTCTGDQHFPYSLSFKSIILSFQANFYLSSTNALKWDESKTLSFGEVLRINQAKNMQILTDQING